MAPPPGPNLRALAGIGGTIAVLVGGGVALGRFLDSRLVTSPVLTLVGLALGVAATGFYLYAIVQKYGKS